MCTMVVGIPDSFALVEEFSARHLRRVRGHAAVNHGDVVTREQTVPRDRDRSVRHALGHDGAARDDPGLDRIAGLAALNRYGLRASGQRAIERDDR